MGIKKYKPITPGRRYYTASDFKEITKKKPEKRLTKGKKRINGRNNRGKITVRRRGGGHKRKYRIQSTFEGFGESCGKGGLMPFITRKAQIVEELSNENS